MLEILLQGTGSYSFECNGYWVSAAFHRPLTRKHCYSPHSVVRSFKNVVRFFKLEMSNVISNRLTSFDVFIVRAMSWSGRKGERSRNRNFIERKCIAGAERIMRYTIFNVKSVF